MPPDLLLHDSFTASLTTTADGLTGREFSLHHVLDGRWSYADAEARALELCPENLYGHKRARLDLAPLGNGYWDLKAAYKTPETDSSSGDGGDSSGQSIANSLSLDTGGGTEHITQALYDGQGDWGGEQAFARPGDTAPDFFGAINCSGDSVQGVDVTVPAFNFTEVWTWPAAALTSDYYRTLYTHTGTTNASAWRLFERGEVLFMGARFDRNRGDPFIPITYQFSARPSRFNFKVGQITILAKRGWQYLWIKYEDKEETAALVKRPKFAYVNDVYPEKDFGALAIGNPFPSLAPRPGATGAGGGGFFNNPVTPPAN
jgi:hypothetical protein